MVTATAAAVVVSVSGWSDAACAVWPMHGYGSHSHQFRMHSLAVPEPYKFSIKLNAHFCASHILFCFTRRLTAAHSVSALFRFSYYFFRSHIQCGHRESFLCDVAAHTKGGLFALLLLKCVAWHAWMWKLQWIRNTRKSASIAGEKGHVFRYFRGSFITTVYLSGTARLQ